MLTVQVVSASVVAVYYYAEEMLDMTLVTPKAHSNDPFKALLAAAIADGTEDKILGPGMVQIGHWSPDANYRVGDWIDLQEIELFSFRNPDGVPDTSVVDSPDQWLELYGSLVEAHERDFCVFFVHVAKDPANRGRGGGWRWHKWGEYVGSGKPQCEYLDDEDGFEGGVYTAHVHEVLEPATEVQR